MGNSNQSCNQCSCQSSPSSTRKSSKSYTDCCTETTCITIENTGNVGMGTSDPRNILCVTDSCLTIETTGNVGPGTTETAYNLCVTDSCNTDIQTKSAERLSRRRSRRGR